MNETWEALWSLRYIVIGSIVIFTSSWFIAAYWEDKSDE